VVIVNLSEFNNERLKMRKSELMDYLREHVPNNTKGTTVHPIIPQLEVLLNDGGEIDTGQEHFILAAIVHLVEKHLNNPEGDHIIELMAIATYIDTRRP